EGGRGCVGAGRVEWPDRALLKAEGRKDRGGNGLDFFDHEVARGRGHARVVEEHTRRHVVDLPFLDPVEDLRQIARRSPCEVLAGGRCRRDLPLADRRYVGRTCSPAARAALRDVAAPSRGAAYG